MALRDSLTDAMKTAMKAGDTQRLSAVRLILAKLKDTEINARGTGKTIEDADILLMLRGMIKPRQEAIALYRQGNRPELAQKEEAEIRVIEGFLPVGLDEQQTTASTAAVLSRSFETVTIGRIGISSSTASALTRAPRPPATATHLSIAAIAAASGSPTSGKKISLIAMCNLLRRRS